MTAGAMCACQFLPNSFGCLNLKTFHMSLDKQALTPFAEKNRLPENVLRRYILELN